MKQLTLIVFITLLSLFSGRLNAQPVMSFGDLPFGDNFFGGGDQDTSGGTSRIERFVTANLSDASLQSSNYVSVLGGWSYALENDQIYGWYPTTQLDDGAAIVFNAGHRYGPRLRSEVEFAFRNNDTRQQYNWFMVMDSLPFYFEQLTGDVNAYSGMVNLYMDFDRPLDRRVTPYAGIGIGMAFIDSDLSWNGTGSTMSDDSTFAYQFIGGLTTRISARSDLLVEYRFFGTATDDYYLPARSTIPDSQPTRVDFRFRSNNLFFGWRVKY